MSLALSRARSVTAPPDSAKMSPRIMFVSLSLRRTPPCFGNGAVQRDRRRVFDIGPARDPLVRHVEERNDIESRHQDTVERANRRDDLFPGLGLEPGGDHGIGGGDFG